MTTKFNEFISGANRAPMDDPSSRVTLKKSGHILYLKFTSKDVLEKASYMGSIDPWLSSLCNIILGKTLSELLTLNWEHWDEVYRDDQSYWDLKVETSEKFYFPALELLRTGLDVYQGREYLYKESDSLICRCFGVRENDVLNYINSAEDPTPEGLAEKTKAGMGCRSCVPQITRWLSINKQKENRFYKDKPRAQWLLEIDYMLSCFPEASEWKMEVQGFQGQQVRIKFDCNVTQREEEEVSGRLQGFLAASVDPDLAFFLIRD